MSFFLGIDLGTSYFKAGVFDLDGRLHGLGRRAVGAAARRGSWYELEIPVFWQTLHSCVREAMESARTTAGSITAVSYSSQANSFLLLDDAFRPLTPLILWPDGRSGASLSALTGRDDFLSATGLGVEPGKHSMLAKTEWIRRNEPVTWGKTRGVMTISDYLTFVITGERVGDLSTSSMTGLLDSGSGKRWETAAGIFNIDPSWLSTPLRTGTFAGRITGDGAARTGLRRGTPLFSGGLDHHMAAVGAGLPGSGYISESTGTVLACVAYKKSYDPRPGVNSAPGLLPGEYFEMAFDANGAAALEWYRAIHAPDYTIPGLLELAADVEPLCGGLVAKPCAGSYEGLSGFKNRECRHSHGHYVRAILESTASSLRGLVGQLQGTAGADAVVPSGGGAQSRLWLQIKADMLGRTFLLPESGELACKGAAMLCAVGMSCFRDIAEAVGCQVRFVDEIRPGLMETAKYNESVNNL